MIQNKIISPKKIFLVGFISFIAASIIGLYLNYRTSGNVILYIGIIGVFLGYFYTAEPFRLGYRLPVGEAIAGFCCGPLIVCGSYYVQTQKLSWPVFSASIPIGILVTLILFINEFQDHDADKQIGKRTIVILLGKKKALSVYNLLLLSAYLWITLEVVRNTLPVFALFVFATIPLSLKAYKTAKIHFDKISELLPANASTIGLHLIIGILLTGSYVVDKFIK